MNTQKTRVHPIFNDILEKGFNLPCQDEEEETEDFTEESVHETRFEKGLRKADEKWAERRSND